MGRETQDALPPQLLTRRPRCKPTVGHAGLGPDDPEPGEDELALDLEADQVEEEPSPRSSTRLTRRCRRSSSGRGCGRRRRSRSSGETSTGRTPSPRSSGSTRRVGSRSQKKSDRQRRRVPLRARVLDALDAHPPTAGTRSRPGRLAPPSSFLPLADHGDVHRADRRDLRAPRARLGGLPARLARPLRRGSSARGGCFNFTLSALGQGRSTGRLPATPPRLRRIGSRGPNDRACDRDEARCWRDALAARRREGVVLGRPRCIPANVRERIVEMRDRGESLAGIARRLNEDGVATAHRGVRWYASTVRAVVGS